MTNKEWLMRAWNIDKEIKALLSERDEAFIKCTSITSSLKQTVVSSSGTPQKDATLVRLAEYDEELRQSVDKLIETKREIREAVSMVDSSTYRLLLYLRYLRFKTWEQIAVEMDFTYQWVCKLHGDALTEIQIIDSN